VRIVCACVCLPVCVCACVRSNCACVPVCARITNSRARTHTGTQANLGASDRSLLLFMCIRSCKIVAFRTSSCRLYGRRHVQGLRHRGKKSRCAQTTQMLACTRSKGVAIHEAAGSCDLLSVRPLFLKIRAPSAGVRLSGDAEVRVIHCL
jgi:hypothetical protein